MIRQALICFLKGYKFVVMDVPLLFEGPMHKIMQKIVVVHCDEENQIQRLMLRDSLAESEARARIQAQMPIEEKRKRATHPVDNNGDIEETKKQIHRIIDEFEASWLPVFIRAGIFTVIIALCLPVIKIFI
uniref:Dephospho-CoA kinase n=1 Tax=Acrobeloides nanus TaxID=290746 RepID=A0A914EBA7_9BILA